LERADLILHGGDLVAASVLRELEAIAPVEGVFGNMDEPALKELLPERSVVEVEGARIGMVHIAGPRVGREERLVSWFPGCDAVVYGHTHLPQLERHRDVWILNPGSPTERRRAPQRSMLVVEIAGEDLDPCIVALP
jgi:putative phosphoesterase